MEVEDDEVMGGSVVEDGLGNNVSVALLQAMRHLPPDDCNLIICR